MHTPFPIEKCGRVYVATLIDLWGETVRVKINKKAHDKIMAWANVSVLRTPGVIRRGRKTA